MKLQEAYAVVRVARKRSERAPDAPPPEPKETSYAAVYCGSGVRRERDAAGVVLRETPLACGTAGCLKCGGRKRHNAVMAVATTQFSRYGHIRLTLAGEVHRYDGADLQPNEALRRLRAFLRTCTRTDRKAPFGAACMVVEVEPRYNGNTLPSCVCVDMGPKAYGYAVKAWGGCAVCGGSQRSPTGHVHAHVVVGHDRPVWYGQGVAPQEHSGMEWATKGLLGRMADAGLGNGQYQPVRGGVGGAAAYLRKLASYDGKVVGGPERSEQERHWWALWQTWYLGPGVRRVSTHGAAYGVQLQGVAVAGASTEYLGPDDLKEEAQAAEQLRQDYAAACVAPPTPLQCPAKIPPPLRAYAYTPRRDAACQWGASVPNFVGNAGLFLEAQARVFVPTTPELWVYPTALDAPDVLPQGCSALVRGDGTVVIHRTTGFEPCRTMVPSVAQVHPRTDRAGGDQGEQPGAAPPAKGRGGGVPPRALHQPLAGAHHLQVKGWQAAAVGDCRIWWREGASRSEVLQALQRLAQRAASMADPDGFNLEVDRLRAAVLHHQGGASSPVGAPGPQE